MELRQNMRQATTQPLSWVAAILIALALGLVIWYAVPKTTSHPASAPKPVLTTVDRYLDRNAERQPVYLDRNAERQPTAPTS